MKIVSSFSKFRLYILKNCPCKYIFYGIGIVGKRVDVALAGKRLPPPMDARNTKGITSALSAFKKEVRSFIEGRISPGIPPARDE